MVVRHTNTQNNLRKNEGLLQPVACQRVDDSSYLVQFRYPVIGHGADTGPEGKNDGLERLVGIGVDNASRICTSFDDGGHLTY